MARVKSIVTFALLMAAGIGVWQPLCAQSNRSNQNNPYNLITGEEEPDTTQNKEPEGIIYDTGEEPDSVMPGYVFRFDPLIRDVKIRQLSHPTLDPTGVQLSNPENVFDGNYYLDRGELGLTHLSLYPFAEETKYLFGRSAVWKPLTRHLQADANPVYRQTLHRNRFFQTQKPYTLLKYGSSLNKDYQIKVEHTQNIMPRWNFAFLYDLVSRDGQYTNSEVTNHILDITTNYYSADARYQIQAALSFNRLRQQENGGVQNDTTCWDYSRLAGVPVNMYAAQNQWRDLELTVHQTFNTVRQFPYQQPVFEKIIDTISIDTGYARAESYNDSDSIIRVYNYTIITYDSIVAYDTILPHQPHVYNTGVFGLDIHFGKHRRIFSDNQPDSWFYNNATLDTTFYYDSTAHYKFDAELYWTNDAYMTHRWRNPMVLMIGVRPEYNRLQFVGSNRSELSVSPFAKVKLDFGKVCLSAAAEEVTGDERNGDYRFFGNANLNMGSHSLSAALLSEAQSPDLMYYHNEGVFAWDYNNFDKVKRQQAAIEYNYQRPDSVKSLLCNINARACACLITDNIWISDNMQPTQGNATGMLMQASVMSHLQLGWFNIQLQEMIQNSRDDDVVRVPLFASKNSLYADLHLFHRALYMQVGCDLRYHTKYYADGWNPVLGAFYRQNDVKVGNYLVADLWINMQIKRASIYLKASHLNALIEQKPSYFSLPHYPMEGFGLYWGVTWKFFN